MSVDSPLPHIRLDAVMEFYWETNCDERADQTAYRF